MSIYRQENNKDYLTSVCIFDTFAKIGIAMPKVLEYTIKGICWIFLFWDTDINENRAHVHIGRKVGKNASMRLCKLWLEPEVTMAVEGDLTDAQIRQVIELTSTYKEQLLKQWALFKKGEKVKIIKIRKNDK